MDAQFFNGCLRLALKSNTKFSISKIYEEENIKTDPSLVLTHLSILNKIDKLFVVTDTEIKIEIKVK